MWVIGRMNIEMSMSRSSGGSVRQFSLGTAGPITAGAFGVMWTGLDSSLSRSRVAIVSEDGLRQFRYSGFKVHRQVNEANLEGRHAPAGIWPVNGHITLDARCP